MRPIISALFCLTIFAVSCKKTDVNYQIPNGTYVGTFQRLTSTGGEKSNVTIIFSGNTWTGQGQYPTYPALCSGTFAANGANNISFDNTCAWTAEFDWTLILSQDYKIKMAGKDIEISRDYNGSFKDIYKLTKQ